LIQNWSDRKIGKNGEQEKITAGKNGEQEKIKKTWN
jgi:hypothetical protein